MVERSKKCNNGVLLKDVDSKLFFISLKRNRYKMRLDKLFTHVRVTPKGTYSKRVSHTRYSKSFYYVFWFNIKMCLVKLVTLT